MCVRWEDKKILCKIKKRTKMGSFIGILKASLPVAIGVAVGMIAYEQIKKATAKVA